MHNSALSGNSLILKHIPQFVFFSLIPLPTFYNFGNVSFYLVSYLYLWPIIVALVNFAIFTFYPVPTL